MKWIRYLKKKENMNKTQISKETNSVTGNGV